ncbi:MAG: TetR family transcriptional regulator, partial [Gaiellaceae bacterium]
MPGLRERKKAQTREAIAETARRLFLEKGFEAVTVAEVAREAEVAE